MPAKVLRELLIFHETYVQCSGVEIAFQNMTVDMVILTFDNGSCNL